LAVTCNHITMHGRIERQMYIRILRLSKLYEQPNVVRDKYINEQSVEYMTRIT